MGVPWIIRHVTPVLGIVADQIEENAATTDAMVRPVYTENSVKPSMNEGMITISILNVKPEHLKTVDISRPKNRNEIRTTYSGYRSSHE